MIVKTVAYGIALTDPIGNPLPGLADLVQAAMAVRAANGHRNNFAWLATCPSPGQEQLVLGFGARIGKSTDFSALDEQWKAAMAAAPEPVKSLAFELGLANPDVHFMAGTC